MLPLAEIRLRGLAPILGCLVLSMWIRIGLSAPLTSLPTATVSASGGAASNQRGPGNEVAQCGEAPDETEVGAEGSEAGLHRADSRALALACKNDYRRRSSQVAEMAQRLLQVAPKQSPPTQADPRRG
jgi:hypothetical protein